MRTKLKPKATQIDPGQALATFERLPEQTKELLKLKHLAEKTTSPEQVVLTKQIKDKARKARP